MENPIKAERSEAEESLMSLAWGPALWLGHFFASYLTVALYCEKFVDPGGSITTARVLCLAYTVVALIGTATLAIRGYRRHRFLHTPHPHAFDTTQHRYRFLGFAQLLLSALSFFAVIYVALPLGFFATCR